MTVAILIIIVIITYCLFADVSVANILCLYQYRKKEVKRKWSKKKQDYNKITKNTSKPFDGIVLQASALLKPIRYFGAGIAFVSSLCTSMSMFFIFTISCVSIESGYFYLLWFFFWQHVLFRIAYPVLLYIFGRVLRQYTVRIKLVMKHTQIYYFINFHVFSQFAILSHKSVSDRSKHTL